MRIALIGALSLSLIACYLVSPIGEIGRACSAGAIQAAYTEGFTAGGRVGTARPPAGSLALDAACTQWWFGADSLAEAKKRMCRR